MRGWSLSLGRYFGVDLRLHALFVLLLPMTVVFSAAVTGSASRGFALWLLLVAAVLVREAGRALVGAAAGLSPSRLVLLPTGAAPHDEDQPLSPRAERLVALAGPLANFFAGITMALLMYSATAGINLFEKPWFSPAHLLRSAIWAQVLLGGLNLLPGWPLDAGVILRRQLRQVRGAAQGTRSAAGIAQGMALLLMVLGVATGNAWPVLMGCSLLLTGRAEVQTAAASTAAESIKVADVMLTEWTTLAASDTLQDAANRSVQSLQDVFPVVRGSIVVGSISRETLLSALRTDGNGYVQSAMTRTLFITSEQDALMPALARVQGQRSAQLIPVVRTLEDDHRLVGILTPGTLSHSMGFLGRTRQRLHAGQKRG